jgi:cytochrome b involved in lipid metabolism
MVEVSRLNPHFGGSWTDSETSVYNVTEYSRDHPGGPDALMEVAGTDATSAYEDVSTCQSRHEDSMLTYRHRLDIARMQEKLCTRS